MSDLKKQLIKLGSTNPELRPHIRPVLDSLSNRTASGKWEYVERPKWTTTSGAYGATGVYAEIKYIPRPTPDLRRRAQEDFKKRAIPVGEAKFKGFKERAKFESGIPDNYDDFYTQAFWMKL